MQRIKPTFQLIDAYQEFGHDYFGSCSRCKKTNLNNSINYRHNSKKFIFCGNYKEIGIEYPVFMVISQLFETGDKLTIDWNETEEVSFQKMMENILQEEIDQFTDQDHVLCIDCYHQLFCSQFEVHGNWSDPINDFNPREKVEVIKDNQERICHILLKGAHIDSDLIKTILTVRENLILTLLDRNINEKSFLEAARSLFNLSEILGNIYFPFYKKPFEKRILKIKGVDHPSVIDHSKINLDYAKHLYAFYQRRGSWTINGVEPKDNKVFREAHRLLSKIESCYCLDSCSFLGQCETLYILFRFVNQKGIIRIGADLNMIMNI